MRPRHLDLLPAILLAGFAVISLPASAQTDANVDEATTHCPIPAQVPSTWPATSPSSATAAPTWLTAPCAATSPPRTTPM
jgi:hypothetical protein